MNTYARKLILFCWLASLLFVRTACGQAVAAPAGGADYLVIDLRTWGNRFSADPPDVSKDACRTEELWLRRIPAGRFTMGSPVGEEGRDDDEAQHEVELGEYFIAVFECTQAQWEAVMGANPSEHLGVARPVERVSYAAIRGGNAGTGWPGGGHGTVGKDSFLDKLRGWTGLMFDLPTEAQWEYACRAGGKDAGAEISDAGRFDGNTDDGKGGFKEHTTVGSYAPNGWGLYDMQGNVAEWCLDWYGGKYMSESKDPAGPEEGKKRVLRGGSWYKSKDECRSASRSSSLPATKTGYVGFRVAVIWTGGKVSAPTALSMKEMKAEPAQTAPLPTAVPESATATGKTAAEITGDVSKAIADGGQDALYLVVDLSGGTEAARYPVRYSSVGPDLNNDTCRTTELWLRRIPKGTFVMGSPEDEIGHDDNETQHEVTLTQDYYIGVFECTQKQWKLLMGRANPSEYKGDCRPVERVSYNMIRGTGAQAGAGWPTYGHAVDSTSFMGKLQAKTGLTFDLPTEAQWEYACRAGTTTALNSGKSLASQGSDANMNELGRYDNNRNDGKGGYSEHTKVGSYQPNAWGLYDMHGNVYEWCLDWYGGYGTVAVSDPVGPTEGSNRVLRGGFWYSFAIYCRSASLVGYYPSGGGYYSHGFRVLCLPKDR